MNLPVSLRAVIHIPTPPTGKTPTSGSQSVGANTSNTINLAVGQDRTDVDFGYQDPAAPTGSIGDYVWDDADGDGIQDAGETGLSSVTVQLLQAGTDGVFGTADDVVAATQVTDANGQYQFTNVAAGNYQVHIPTPPTGKTPTNGAQSVGANTSSILNLAAGQVKTDVDFGYQSPPPATGSIGDYVWNDTDGDGIQDADEAGLVGVAVQLVQAGTDGIFGTADDVILATQTTTAGGNYQFANLTAGDYQVRIPTPPAGTLPSVGPQAVGSNSSSTISLVAGQVKTDIDFGYTAPPPVTPGSIGDFIWNDLDGDGIQDIGEPGLVGVEVKLTLPSGGTVVTTTDANGQYLFDNLTPGAYIVEVTAGTLPATLSPSSGSQSVGGYTTALNINSGENRQDIDFGYQPGTGLIGDFIWDDIDGDGVQDSGEAGLSGVPVELTWAGPDGILGNGDDVTFNTTTDANGQYQFNGLPEGQYQVAVTTPPAGKNPTTGSDSVGANSTTLLLNTGETRNDIDFGYQSPGTSSIGDLVWYDTDGDGVVDPDEPGLANVTVILTKPDGSTIQVETDANGRYRFEDLPAGDYQVSVDPNDLPSGIDSTLDSSAPFTLGANEQKDDIDFGFKDNGIIGDYIWNDTDGDGIQDPDEQGISGLTVELTWAGPDGIVGNGDDKVFTTTTDAGGRYQFLNLPAGTFEVVVPNPPTDSQPTSGAQSIGADSTIVELSSGEVRGDIDFGYQNPNTSSVGDLIWYDTDGDGEYDPGEPGLSGVTVILIKPDGTTATTQTDANGRYRFDNLPAGEYTVTLSAGDIPSGIFSTTHQGALPTFTLGENEQKMDVDIGFRGNAAIGDYIWEDSNGDGIQDPSEQGLANVGVAIVWAGQDGILGNSDDVTYTTVTDINGRYEVRHLPAGNYSVTITSGIPAGLNPVAGPESIGAMTAIVELAPNHEKTNVDFGFTGEPLGQGKIGDLIWYDTDGDGQYDAGELPLSGVTVTLTGPEGLTLTTVTDANGQYEFTGLPAGDYQVTLDPADLPAGVTTTLDSSAPFSLATDEVKQDVDFGFIGTATVGDFIWDDTDGDGIQDPDETGLAGVTVNLTWAGPDGILGSPDDVVFTAETDANGRYSLNNLPAGNYQATVAGGVPAGMTPTTGADSAGAGESAFTLTSGETKQDVDFGFTGEPLGTGSIGNLVWYDADGDGQVDPDEPPLANVRVTLTGPDGLEITVVTDENGRYLFEDLPPGQYQVTVNPDDLPDGVVNTLDSSTPFELQEGEAKTDVIFGYVGTGILGDYIWHDIDGDGRQDAGEPSLSNVEVMATWAGQDGIFGNADDVVYTTTTGDRGSYFLAQLPEGRYQVAVVGGLPEGYQPTSGEQSVGAMQTEFFLAGQEINLNVDFGFTDQPLENGQIGDLVWYDTDGDGQYDLGELTLSGVFVTLTGTNGVTLTIATDANGQYTFTDVPAGEYQVTLTPSTLPEGVTATLDSSAPFTLASGEIKNDVDFGFVGSAAVGDFIWNDVDGDGVQDPNEAGLAGVTVNLTWAGLDGILGNADDIVFTTETDANGRYTITDLPAGNYQATVTNGVPTGMTPTTGTDTAGPGESRFTLTPGEVKQDVDFGYTLTSTDGALGDYVWADENGDGVQAADEAGFNNVELQITWAGEDGVLGSADDEIFMTTTTNNGRYLVEQLPEGLYQVAIVSGIPEGYQATSGPQSVGSTQTVASLARGETKLDIDFGFEKPEKEDEDEEDKDPDEEIDPDNPPTDGEDGNPPTDGSDGNPPTDGSDGNPPTDGSDGNPPTDGSDANPPADGSDGNPPTDGSDGNPPTDGSDGNPPTDGSDGNPPTDGSDGNPPADGSDGNPPTDGSDGNPPTDGGDGNPPTDGGDVNPPTDGGDVNPPTDGGDVNPPTDGGDGNPPIDDTTPPPYEYSVFHNEAEDRLFGEEDTDDFGFHRSAELEWKMPVLPVAPIYSGIVASGTTLKITLYSEHGVSIGEQTVMADVGGNWLASFPNAIIHDMPHDVKVEQVTAVYNDNVMSLFDMRTYFAPALSPQLFFSHQMSVLTVMSTTPSKVMMALHQAYMRPFATHWNDYNEYEFFAGSVTTSQASF